MPNKDEVITEYLNFIANHHTTPPLRSAWILLNSTYMYWGTILWQAMRNTVSRISGTRLDLSGKTINIGAGLHPVDGILNTEFIPTIKNTLLLRFSSRKTYWLNIEYPELHVRNASALVISHVLEHLKPENVIQALKNCHDILAPGAPIRVAVPDLKTYVVGDPLPKTQNLRTRAVAVNQLVYCHGHRVMFDAELLSALLIHVGFTELSRHAYREGPLGEFDTAASQDESLYLVACKARNQG